MSHRNALLTVYGKAATVAGGWLTAGDADLGTVRSLDRDPVTGVALAETRATAPRRTTGSRSGPSAGAPRSVSTAWHTPDGQ